MNNSQRRNIINDIDQIASTLNLSRIIMQQAAMNSLDPQTAMASAAIADELNNALDISLRSICKNLNLDTPIELRQKH